MLDARARSGPARPALLPILLVPAVLSAHMVLSPAWGQSSGGYVSPYQQGPTRPFDGSPRSGVYAAQPAPSYEQTPKRLGGRPADPYYHPPIWNGLYLGLNAGFSWQTVRFDSAFVPDLSRASGSIGGHVGYNWQFDNFVLGVEGDMARVGGSSSTSAGSASALMEAGWESTLRARAGVAIGKALVYGTAGFAMNSQKVSVTTSGSTLTTNDLRYGAVAGGGVEMMLAPNISTRLEALHYGFASDSTAVGTIKQTDNVLRAGLSFKFN